MIATMPPGADTLGWNADQLRQPPVALMSAVAVMAELVGVCRPKMADEGVRG
jgi:hypothetical protein